MFYLLWYNLYVVLIYYGSLIFGLCFWFVVVCLVVLV